MTDATAKKDQELIDKFLSENVSFIGPDMEIRHDHSMKPRSAREEEALNKNTDDQVLRDIRSMVGASLDETFEIVEQTAASPAAKCADMSCAVFSAAGEMSLAANRGVAGFAAILSPPIRYIIKHFADDSSVGVNEGDAFVSNDARYGGIHSPDLGMFMPVFHEGERICWVACSYHQGEIGAREPGGMGPGIESPWDEGFRGSPMKLVENRKLRRDTVNMMQNTSREPAFLFADLKSRLSACLRLEKRIHEAIETFGVDAVVSFLRRSIEDVETETARRLREIPETTVSGSCYVDSTLREDAVVRLRWKVTFKDGRMTVDTRGSSPEIANRPLNSTNYGLSVGTMLGLTTFVWPDLPPNPVLLNNIDFIADERSVCNSGNDMPVALCMMIVFKVINIIEIAFAKATYSLPNRYANVKAPWYNQPVTFIYGGITQHNDAVGNCCGNLNGMPGGARWDQDGEHSIAPNFSSMVDCGECEDAEEALPYQYIVGKVIEKDNCGFGKFRGGSGFQFGIMRFGQQPFGFQAICAGSKFPSVSGLFGGYGSPVFPTAKISGDDLYGQLKADPKKLIPSMQGMLNERPFDNTTYESRPGSWTFEFSQEGDIYLNTQGAGGGYGDVLDRESEAVIKDVEEGVISHEVAQGVYFIRYDEETLVLDVEATKAARDAERKARLDRSLSYDDYMAQEVTAEPELSVPYFGSWDDPELLYADKVSGAPGTLPPIFIPDPRDVKIAQLEAQLAETTKS